MIEIQEIGDFFELDANGFIINPCTPGKIAYEYVPLLDELIAEYQSNANVFLHSIYLRGSVPAGKAIPGFSDLDMLGLLKWDKQYRFIRWGTASWEAESNSRLLPAYPFVKHLDLAIAHHDPAFPGKNFDVKMILKTQAMCVWGESVIGQIPPFRPGKAAMINYKWVPMHYQLWKDQEGKWDNEQAKVEFIQAACKTIVRAGFELCMQRLGKYATDLYPCYQSFSDFYPEKQAEMRLVLQTFLNPIDMQAGIEGIMQDFAPWLIEEIQNQIVKS